MAKINWNLDYNETAPIEIEGVTIQVKKRIPYEKKVEFASAYADACTIIKDNGVAFLNPFDELTLIQLTLDYYTDVELDEGDNLGSIYDFDIKTGMFDKIKDAVGEDLDRTIGMAECVSWRIIDDWKQQHSIQAAISDFLNDDKLEQIAQSPELNEEMIDFLHAQKAKEEGKIVPMLEFAKKKKDD